MVDVNPRHQENQLSLIEKQRRGWEGAREKAEEMAQIFDSLIITSRPNKVLVVMTFYQSKRPG
jgi:hypothetical protein